MRDALTRVDEAYITDRFVEADTVNSGIIHRMAAYLAQKRGERLIAAREDIDPAELRDILPHIVLVDIQTDPLSVYYRLVGTRIAEFYGEFSRSWMHNRPISDAYKRVAENIYGRLIETKAPIFGVTEMRTRFDSVVSYEWGYFPLSSNGETVTGGLEIESPERRVVGVQPDGAETFVRGC